MLDRYANEISDFRSKYNALSENDQAYARNIVGTLAEYYKLRTIRDYFGVNVSF